jgi:hypothetical protein
MADVVTLYIQLPGRTSSCSLKASLSRDTAGGLLRRLLDERVVSAGELAACTLHWEGEELEEQATLEELGVYDEAIMALVELSAQQRRRPRWLVSLVLTLSCMMMIGCFYCLENPAALMKQLVRCPPSPSAEPADLTNAHIMRLLAPLHTPPPPPPCSAWLCASAVCAGIRDAGDNGP